MVPLDELVASHDMVLRFLAVDTLFAAGESASVPSNIGEETASVLSPVAKNGSTLASSAKNTSSVENLSSSASETLDRLSGLDRSHESYYGPRRSAGLFILLMMIGLLVWSFAKWRASRRVRKGRSRYGRLGKANGRSKRRNRKGVGHGDIRLSGGELERRSQTGELKRNLSIVREVDEEDEPSIQEKTEHLYGEGQPLFELGEEEEDLLTESDGDIGSTTTNPWKASI